MVLECRRIAERLLTIAALAGQPNLAVCELMLGQQSSRWRDVVTDETLVLSRRVVRTLHVVLQFRSGQI